MIQKRYPLYLANRPQQPNADLAVVDKFSDKVVSHVALADERVLDQAIAAAADAAGPMRRLGAWQRKAVLKHLLAALRRAPRRVGRCARCRSGEADSVCKGGSRPAARYDRACGRRVNADFGRSVAARYDAARGRLSRHVAAGAGRAVRVHYAVELPAQSGGAQDCSGHRLRLSICAQAGQLHADQRAHSGRDSGRDRSAGGAFSILPMRSARCGGAGGGRADQEAELHRLGERRLGFARSGPQEARYAGAGRQRGGHRGSRCRCRRRD